MLGQIRSCYVRLGQVISGYARLGHVKKLFTGQDMLLEVRLG
jgi:hypothetical protein